MFRNRCSVVLLGIFLACATAMADSIVLGPMTVTSMAESSPTYPVGANFAGLTTNSISLVGPFSGLIVGYLGNGNGGNPSNDFRLGVGLVYRFKLDFSEPVVINAITMTGAGDQRGNSVMRLLDFTGSSELSVAPITLPPSGQINQLGTWTLPGMGATGTTFFYDEYDQSGSWRLRSNLVVDYSVVPEPTSLLLLGTGLGGIALAAYRRRKA